MKSKSFVLGSAVAFLCLGGAGQIRADNIANLPGLKGHHPYAGFVAAGGTSTNNAPATGQGGKGSGDVFSDQGGKNPDQADESQTDQKESPSTIEHGSKLIGMEVKNKDGEKLGTIKDVVLNFQSGRVAYLVVEKAGQSDQENRFVAVPLAAFTPSTDKESLALSVEKDRFQNARGYSMNDLPSVGNPIYGAEPSMPEHIIIVPVPVTPQRPGQGQDEEQNQPPENEHHLNPSSDSHKRYL